MPLKITKFGCDDFAIGCDTDTGEKGTLRRYINGSGSASVKGCVLSASTTNDFRVVLQANEYDAFCICAESGIDDGALMWCWIIGSTCQVLFKDGESATRGFVALCADTDGRCLNVAVPSSTPGAAEHWKEVGHVAESKSSGTDILVLVHTHYN